MYFVYFILANFFVFDFFKLWSKKFKKKKGKCPVRLQPSFFPLKDTVLVILFILPFVDLFTVFFHLLLKCC